MTLAKVRGHDSDLDWLGSLLWDGTDALLVPNGAAPTGYHRAERYAVVPPAGRPRLLVPVAPRRAAVTALGAYAGLRPPGRRLGKSVLTAAAAAGLLPRPASVWFRPGAGDLAHASLPAHLAELLDAPRAVAAVTFGTPGPNRKPLLELIDRRGRVLGFAKVGWNESTRGQVRAEAQALAGNHGAFATFTAPRLLARGSWRDLELSVASPLPTRIRRHRDPDRLPPVEVTREIAASRGLRTTTLVKSGCWRRVRSRLDAATGLGVDAQAAAQRLAGRLVARDGDRRLTFGAWHGDWAPWNVGWCGGRLHVWDWEHSHGEVPLGLDLLHWCFQVAFVLRRLDLDVAVRAARQGAEPHLHALGVDPAAGDLLVRLYLLELFARFEAAARAGAQDNRRFSEHIVAILEVH